MTRVFGWAASESDGCFEYRVRMPLEALRDFEHETAFGTSWGGDWLNCDVVLGQRIAMPKPSAFWQGLARRDDRPRMVYELDDDFWSLDPTNPAAQFFRNPLILRNIEDNIRASDRVTVSTATLADVVRGVDPGADVRVIQNAVPEWLTRWRPATISAPSVASSLVVGWAGSATHAMDWSEAAYQVDRFVRRRNDVELHMIGMNYALGDARFTPWSTSVADYWKSIDFDIGLAPLRDHPFNDSKSDIRILEFAALGIPVVASAVGPYAESVKHGVAGFLVRHEHEWGRFLRTLVEDAGLREALGRASHTWAKTRTIEKTARLWESALTSW